MPGTIILTPLQLQSSTGNILAISETGRIQSSSQIVDGDGNSINSVMTSTGRALNVQIHGASALQISNLTGTTPITVTGGTGATFQNANISIGNGKADGATKGVVTFLAVDFNDNGSGLVSIDYTNGQKATALQPGFLTATDWSTFNNKQGSITTGNLSVSTPLIINSGSGTGAVVGSGLNIAVPSATITSTGVTRLSNSYVGTSQVLATTEKALSDGLGTKENTLTKGNLTTSSPLSNTDGTGAVIGSGINITIANAQADGITKGVSTFASADFNATSTGLISIDYANGQKASASQPGFLTSSGWSTFNGKQNALTNPITGTGVAGQHAEFNGTTTIYGVANNTAFNQNFETSTGNIKMDGVVSVGALNTIPRADHRHATDTSRQAADGDLTAIANLTSTGLAVRTASDTWAIRAIVAGSTKVSVSNGGGTTGNPSIDIVEANIQHQNIGGHGTNGHTAIDSHIASTSNPHGVTKSQVGLGNVTNDRQVKATATTTIGNIPTWSTSTGDLLANGYGVDTVTLSNSSSVIPVSSVVKAAINAVTMSGALIYKGSIDCSGNPNYSASSTGWVYVVSVAGKIGGASGVTVEVGDMILCITTNGGGTQAAVGAYFDIIQANLIGAVTGPASSVSENIPSFNGTSGKVIQDSGYKAQDASITVKGFTQLSNSYSGTSQVLATTEKALLDGLGTKENTLTKGNLSATSPLSQSGGTGAVIGSGVSLSIADAKADGSTKGASAYTASDFNDNGSGLISIDYTNGQAASGSTKGFLTSADWTTFNSKEPAVTKGNLTGTSPISVTGGTGAVIGSGASVSIGNASADGSTKGIATFTATDFNDNGSGVLSIDYTNAQKATSGQPGFLTAADWSTFNSKEPAVTKGNLTAGSTKITIGGTETGAVIGTGVSVDVNEANLNVGDMTGTLAIGHGGTGQTTANTALNALLPSQTGNTGKVLQTDGSTTSWQTNSSAGFSSKCRARRTSAQNVAANSWTKIQFNTEDFDIGSEFDNVTNYRFTATTAGYYQVNASVAFTANAGDLEIGIALYKDGSVYSIAYGFRKGGNNASANISDLVYLASSGYIEVYAWQDNGTRAIDITSGNQAYISIHRLS